MSMLVTSSMLEQSQRGGRWSHGGGEEEVCPVEEVCGEAPVTD